MYHPCRVRAIMWPATRAILSRKGSLPECRRRSTAWLESGGLVPHWRLSQDWITLWSLCAHILPSAGEDALLTFVRVFYLSKASTINLQAIDCSVTGVPGSLIGKHLVMHYCTLPWPLLGCAFTLRSTGHSVHRLLVLALYGASVPIAWLTRHASCRLNQQYSQRPSIMFQK